MPFPKPRAAALAVVPVAFAVWTGAHAQDFRPGLWEMTASNLPKPQTFCFTDAMRKDPKIEGQKHGVDCKKENETVSGDTLSYWVICTTPKGRQASRVTVVTLGPDHFTTINESAVDTGRGPVTVKGSMTYRRVGECN
jgi:hypothetical protein